MTDQIVICGLRRVVGQKLSIENSTKVWAIHLDA